MTMRSTSLLLLLVASISCISTLVATEAAIDDEAALLAFKAAAISGSDYGNALASWNQSTSYCSWEGVRCRGRLQRVVALDLRFQRLGGILSPAVGNLSSLRYLNLTSTGLSGDIPSSLGRLHRLHALDLGTNAFSGEIPANLSSCTSLTTLILRFNHLHGRVPPEIGHKLTRLRELNLWNNSLTGSIPASLANLSSLGFLSLAYNQLEGTIPPGLGSIPGLQYLALAYNNLSGEPPVSLYNLSSLGMLQIQGNMLHGGIPTDIGTKFPSIFCISFGINQFTGSIPPSISNLTALQLLDLSRNRFSGYVPHTLGQLQALQTLVLYENMLQANNNVGWEFITSLSNCSQLQSLLINSNPALTGHLPSSIGNLSSTTLQYLYLEETGISGSIPSTIGNLVNLNLLAVANTSISGAIPESIGELANLGVLALYNNDLSGLIPSSIGNLSKLTALGANNNNLQGPIPPSIGKLNNLYVLDLSINNLNGSIPKEIFKLPLLSRYLSLSHNLLSGPLPSEVGSLQNLNRLYLSGNQLSGEIPTSIGECTVLEELWLDNNLFNGSIPQSFKGLKGLKDLKMSMNKLSGTIPDAIGSILNLQQLYLDHNNLSGPIPTVLQNLTLLSELDLSYNNLQGKVPKEGIFRNLTQFSITGNSELCGGILQLHLVPCQNNLERKIKKGRLKPLTISLAATGALLLLALIVSLYWKLRQKQNLLQQQIVDDQYERVSYHALASGTNGFSEANLLGKGTFGEVYKCTFPEHGTTAAVKVFNLEQSGSSRSFAAECEALRMVRHRCLIKIITCCSSINHQGTEFKALVFEYMPNGSLHDWLHPKSNMPTHRNSLSLEQRLDIIVDIVDALDYLHNHCQPQIVHCDLKPSNILIAEDMSARVGDFGISRILPESVSATLQNSNSTIGVRGSIGYIAPEYGEGASISTLGDVYSLGILLLEIFTGRSPTDDMFTGSMDLLKFSEDALPDRIWEIVDVAMWLHTDANDSTTRSKIENCLVSTVALGISCAKKQPRERAPIQDVATKMHAIRDSYKKITEGEHGAATTLQ